MEEIHVCYALTDKEGTYSKFVGVSLLSLWQHTSSRITAHILTDAGLSVKNRQRFEALAKTYGQKVCFHNVREKIRDTWERGRQIYAAGLASPRYTEANMYRLTLPQVLPPEIERAIYLDGDTVVELDIASLWQEPTRDYPIAAVPDMDALRHYDPVGEIRAGDSFLYRQCGATVATVFNAGVMVLNLKKLRAGENLFLAGLTFLKEHHGEAKFYDNDILIAFFSQNYAHLPWRYNIRLNWAQAYGEGEVTPGIYHCLGRNYGLNPAEPYHALFLKYFRQTPWFGEDILYREYAVLGATMLNKMKERLVQVRNIYNICRRKKRIFVGLAEDEFRLRADFALTEEEIYIKLDPATPLALPYDPAQHVYVFFWSDYLGIKKALEAKGLREYEHFVDGTRLMEGQTADLTVNELTVLWHL